jgi:hypothetical protein
MRWLGASIRLTGMTGVCFMDRIGELSGSLGNSDFDFASSLTSRFLWNFSGVKGHEDRS